MANPTKKLQSARGPGRQQVYRLRVSAERPSQLVEILKALKGWGIRATRAQGAKYLRVDLRPTPDLGGPPALSASPTAQPSNDPIARTSAAYRAMVDSSLTVEQAARRLGVDASRIRQRLGPSGDLYGFKVNDEWRLPAFLFERDGVLVPNIERVLRSLPKHLHPLAVRGWFLTPHPDLYLAQVPDQDLSPLEWLSVGGDPEKLANIAKHAGIS